MSRDTATVFDHLHQYGVDLRAREIYLQGPVEYADDTIRIGIDHVVRNIRFLDKTQGDIYLFIQTDGGSVEEAVGLYDMIQQCTNDVTGVVFGECCSAGIYPLIACDHRYATKEAALMFHQNYTGIGDHLQHYDAQSRAAYEKVSFDRCCKLIGSRTGKDSAWWKRRMKEGEIWMHAPEMIEHGLISELWNGEG